MIGAGGALLVAIVNTIVQVTLNRRAEQGRRRDAEWEMHEALGAWAVEARRIVALVPSELGLPRREALLDARVRMYGSDELRAAVSKADAALRIGLEYSSSLAAHRDAIERIRAAQESGDHTLTEANVKKMLRTATDFDNWRQEAERALAALETALRR